MSKKSVEDILISVFKHDPSITKNGEELSFYCPRCKHYKKKLSINVTHGYYKCWVCKDFKGKNLTTLLKSIHAPQNTIELLKQIYKYNSQKPKLQDTNRVLKLPNEFHPLHVYSKRIQYKSAINYCKRRGLTKYDILRYNIGYCETGEYQGKIVIPSYDTEGNLNFFCSRAFYDSFMTHRLCDFSKNIIGFESFINFNKPISLVEGVFDAFAIRYNVIPLFGKIMSEALKIKLLTFRPPRVNVVLDNDALEETIDICHFLTNNGISTHLIALDEKDPSQIGFDKITSIIDKSIPIDKTELFKLEIKSKL